MRFVNSLRLVALSAVLFSAACKKRGQFEVPCKIKTITSSYQYAPEYPAEVNVATFTNNAWGDPVSIIQSVPTTGRPHYYFTYDNNQRLKTWKAEYGPGNIEYYTKYYYDNNNFIVRDTTWFQGFDINDLASFGNRIVSEYAYDSKGRVAKVNSMWVGIPISALEKVYTYDANDNLIRPGATYDNKTNYLRTSLVLAFMMRDYSKNNYIGALTYNTKNLPTSYSTDYVNGRRPSFFNTPITGIGYSCDNNDND
jgi:hypothetical protein